MFALFFKAFLIGLSIAMPIGPIATLCIKNAISRGWRMGFAVGLGAALAEGFYGFVVSGGFVFISDFIMKYLFEIKLIGSFVLLFIGFTEIKNRHDKPSREIKMQAHGFFRIMIFVMLLTIANPMTIIYFASVFASMGAKSLDFSNAAIMVIGVFAGSLAWTAFLSAVVSIIRHKISQVWMVRIKIISGLMIAGFGLFGLINI